MYLRCCTVLATLIKFEAFISEAFLFYQHLASLLCISAAIIFLLEWKGRVGGGWGMGAAWASITVLILSGYYNARDGLQKWKGRRDWYECV
jgi:hypothetical protein